jgi:hypothetical protein
MAIKKSIEDDKKDEEDKGGVEGYKQDKVVHDDKEHAKYLERGPEEICTYSKTKKEFQT